MDYWGNYLDKMAAKAFGLKLTTEDEEWIEDGEGGIMGEFRYKCEDGVLYRYFLPTREISQALDLFHKFNMKAYSSFRCFGVTACDNNGKYVTVQEIWDVNNPLDEYRATMEAICKLAVVISEVEGYDKNWLYKPFWYTDENTLDGED